MTTILAIDPGLARCGVVCYEPERGALESVRTAEILSPADAIEVASGGGGTGPIKVLGEDCTHLVIEHVGHYGTGQNVGKDVFDTCVLIGRLAEAWDGIEHSWVHDEWERAHLMLRPDVKTYLCRKRGATDAMVRQAVLDRFPRTGGGATPQVGVKDQRGPLYGVKGDAWQALALAITYAETVLELPPLRVEIG